jgi:squalene-hopene/tetraprenyl-beta-curcumene cyclase
MRTKYIVALAGSLAILTLAWTMFACSHEQKPPRASNTWNPKIAASYLDARETWWMNWVGSARDHDTYCVSCHTALPYALARPALRPALGESQSSADERSLIDDVTKRVRLWNAVSPYYSEQGYDQKTPESRGTESVLNALILASHDAQTGMLTADTRSAFDHMWALQQSTGDGKGSWQWLQFDQEPWEARDSGYYGAALAAIAVGTAPDNYASSPEIQERLGWLRDYLNRNSASQSTINRVFLLWASTKLPGLLAPAQQKVIIQEALSKQQSDGGWRLASISWKWNGWTLKSLVNMWVREDGTPMRGKSDGVATGLITLVLQEAGVPRENAQLQKGLSWLKRSQTAQGSWPAESVNKQKHMSSDTRLFMNDAGTAFAVLALTESERPASSLTTAADRRHN